ncbi:hypothetical protein TNCV_3037401 [Trichonephila clavipes]|nr:hypothetical protein TNCV_3037401 [Trichonephila clavipes]
MNLYTNAELENIHFIYRQRKWTFCSSVVWGKISNVAATESSYIRSGASELAVHGSFRVTIEGIGWPRTARTPVFEDELHAVDQNTGTSVQALAVATGGSRATVSRVLQSEVLHPFHVQRPQILQPGKYPLRVAFAQWFVDQSAADMHFANFVLFCEEETFHIKVVQYAQNAYVGLKWACMHKC